MPTGGNFTVESYPGSTGGTAETKTSVISDDSAQPIKASNTYIGKVSKVFTFENAADAGRWAQLEGSPILEIYTPDGDTPSVTVVCIVDVNGNNAIVEGELSNRFHTPASGISNTYFLRFKEIVNDISPVGVSYYH